MSQIGSGDGAPGLESAGAGRLWPEIFMSAMLTYFGFIVTQSSALTKGSYRTAGSRWSTFEPAREARSDVSARNISRDGPRRKSGITPQIPAGALSQL